MMDERMGGWMDVFVRGCFLLRVHLNCFCT